VTIPFGQSGFEFFKVLRELGANLLQVAVKEVDLSNGNNYLVIVFVPK
jgi:hypothetical protein